MFDILTSILSKVDADYADIRYEIKKEVIISLLATFIKLCKTYTLFDDVSVATTN
jgi:hypothetical protein